MCVTMGDISDLDRQIEQLRRCELIKENEVKALCAKARYWIIIQAQSNEILVMLNIYS